MLEVVPMRGDADTCLFTGAAVREVLLPYSLQLTATVSGSHAIARVVSHSDTVTVTMHDINTRAEVQSLSHAGHSYSGTGTVTVKIKTFLLRQRHSHCHNARQRHFGTGTVTVTMHDSDTQAQEQLAQCPTATLRHR